MKVKFSQNLIIGIFITICLAAFSFPVVSQTIGPMSSRGMIGGLPAPIYINNGNVGIGTTNPGAPLEIRGTSANSDQLRIGDTGSATTYFKIGRGGSGNLDFTSMQPGAFGYTFMSGNVGIGEIAPNSPLHVAGSIASAFAAYTASFTVTAANSVLTSNATTGTLTFTLPTAVGIAGRRYTFKRIDASANATIVDGAGTETIDGALTKTLGAQWSAITIISNGANWIIESQMGTIS